MIRWWKCSDKTLTPESFKAGYSMRAPDGTVAHGHSYCHLGNDDHGNPIVQWPPDQHWAEEDRYHFAREGTEP